MLCSDIVQMNVTVSRQQEGQTLSCYKPCHTERSEVSRCRPPYADINQLLKLLLSGIQKILGAKLIGLYLYGSLVIGDFDPNISDIDLVAALSFDIDDKEFGTLQKMHDDFANNHKQWDDRIEVCYISVVALHAVRSHTSQIANISPGEPFHRRESHVGLRGAFSRLASLIK